MRAFLLLLLLAGCAVKTDFPGQSFLGAKYINSPLGEGYGIDPDPLIRADAFDCTTFVETVLSNNNLQKLNKIRYKNGDVDFLNRNHFIELDWLQNNADLIKDITAQYGKTDIKQVVIDKKTWFKKVHNLDTDFVPQVVNIEYLPYENITDLKANKTMIVLFVADNSKNRDKIGTDLGVVHMGLLLPNGILRHASSEYKKVMDVGFDEYLQQRRRTKTNLGIILLEIK